MKPPNENDLTKMFLMSHDTYDKLNNQIKEVSLLRTLNDELKNSIKNRANGAQDKWLNYRNKLIKLDEKKRGIYDDQMMENISNNLRNQYETDMFDRSMNKIVKSGKKVPDKWLRYRDLLFKRGLQNSEKKTSQADYKKNIYSVKLLNDELAKILNNRKLRNNVKWLKYRHLLYKHGLHKPDDDDVELDHAIWADRLNKHRKNVQIQTMTPVKNDSFSSELNKTPKNIPPQSNESAFTPQSGETSFASGSSESFASPQVKEVIYAYGSSSDEEPQSPRTLALEHEKQRRYASKTLNARRLLNNADIRNNLTDINPEDIDDVGTEWAHRSLITEHEQKQLEPLAFPNRQKIGPINHKNMRKKIIYDNSHDKSEGVRRIEEFYPEDLANNTKGYKRRLEFVPPTSSAEIANDSFASVADFSPPRVESTPYVTNKPSRSSRKIKPKSIRKENAINTPRSMKQYYKVVKTPKTIITQQKGTGRSNILRWESYR